MHATPAEPAAGPLPAARTHRVALRAGLLTLGGALLLTAAAVFAYELAASRVPEHRAALEDLLRAETGLDVRFNELSLHWGWYGPEVVFRAVALGAPGGSRPLLTASRLVVGVDLWRVLRSGELQIGRITFIDPDIDLTRAPASRAVRAGAPAAPASPAALLARWRGVRIDVAGGTLRAGSPAAPLSVGIRTLQLRRAGTQWNATALLALPPSLGGNAEVTLWGDAATPEDLSGTLSLTAERLALGGWRALLPATPATELVPRAGSGNLTARIVLAHGAVRRAEGSLEATELAWPSAQGAAPGFALERLRTQWRLARSASGWHLALEPLELGRGAPPAALTLDATPDGSALSARLERAPLGALEGLVRSLNPGIALAAPRLGGTLREARIDWNSTRPAGERLKAFAQLEELSLAPAGTAVRLSGLEGTLQSEGHGLTAELRADGARVTLAGDPDFALAPVTVQAHLELDAGARGWQLRAPDLQIRAADTLLKMNATLAADGDGRPRLVAKVTLNDAPLELVRKLLGSQALGALGDAGELTAGSIEHAELTAAGFPDEPLPWSGPHREFAGAVVLHAASLTGAAAAPDLTGLDAGIEWRGTRVRMRVGDATSGNLKVVRASGEWDARDASLVRLSGRLRGPAEQALAWLKDHPQAGRYAPAVEGIELRGAAILDFDLKRATAARLDTRMRLVLDGAQLRAVTGLPAIEALHGTLAFADGQLQRSSVSGRWLGGPIALSVSERAEHGSGTVSIAGHGVLDARTALSAAGARTEDRLLEGNAEWTADLRLVPAAAGQPASLRVRADSSLVGLTSRLPEPFAKAAGAAFAVHAELQGTADAGELRVALGERLRGLMALKRRGELWQLERGAVRFGTSPPVLPPVPVVRIEGSVNRLDLPAYASLWRALSHNPAWPALRVELSTAELLAAGRSFADVHLAAESAAGADVLRLESPDLAGVVRLPAVIDAAHPVSVSLERLDVPELAAAPAAAALLGSLTASAQLAIDDLRWQGRSLGTLSANVAVGADALELSEVRLSGADGEARGALRCRAICSATFSLESRAAAGTLAQLAATDLTAARSRASGELDWPAAAAPSWSTVSGVLHVELDDGLARRARAAAAQQVPVGLLAVPGLIAGLKLPELPFTRLTADFTVGDGQAFTSDLHLDGDTEILLRGRIGLAARDYDAEVWVLKGEERLPAAVRSLMPGPGVAALWLSLRELFTGTPRERAALRLRGTWNDPMVTEP
ncbi:MAG TPA: DUF3971 domain-containing protein [Steroidobacteraceae bacterium]|jgi:uncharacterized protein YhdP|nr:DUF3971 domain-containing protein [Steroidobacteraceae bacterium]